MQKESKKSTANSAQLQAFHQRLQKGLKDLEKQYQELMLSVEQNKINRRSFAQEGQLLQKRMRRIANRLQKFSPYAKRQKEFLEKLQAFQKRNEDLMLMISDRLEAIEKRPEDENQDMNILKRDLLGMLGELSDMRRKREELLNSIKQAV